MTDYFRAYPGVPQRVPVRGGEAVEVIVGSARLQVNAHGQKRFVVALKYPGEAEYLFLVATDLGWRTQDILRAPPCGGWWRFSSRTGSSKKDGGRWPNSPARRGQAEA